MKMASLSMLATATSAAGEGAASCDIAALVTMLTDGNATTCVAQTGYAVASMMPPTDEQKTAICDRQVCQDALDTLQQLAPEECTIGTIRLYGDVVDPLTAFCSGISGSDSGSFATAGSDSGSDGFLGSGSIDWDGGVVGISSSLGSEAESVASSFSASGMASGSAGIMPPAIRTPRPATPTPTPSPRPATPTPTPSPAPSPSPTPATGNGVAGLTPLSTCTVAAVLATMVGLLV